MINDKLVHITQDLRGRERKDRAELSGEAAGQRLRGRGCGQRLQATKAKEAREASEALSGLRRGREEAQRPLTPASGHTPRRHHACSAVERESTGVPRDSLTVT